MADRFLPKKKVRKLTTAPAWFTDKAQRVSALSKPCIALHCNHRVRQRDKAKQALPRARR
eukprot:1416957-Pleurochrysis_carterae.AAC.1